jgi:hypothetical protein
MLPIRFSRFSVVPGAGADLLLTEKANQQTLDRQIDCQFQENAKSYTR